MAVLSNRMKRCVQPQLADFEPYDPCYEKTKINLSANENNYPLPHSVTLGIKQAFECCELNRYPDPMANILRDKLAFWHRRLRKEICVGNGGDELLFNFLLAFGGKNRRVLIASPTFSEYRLFAELTDTKVIDIPRDPQSFDIKRDELLKAAEVADIVILTSPNNPTGNLIEPEFTEKLSHVCSGLVMIDEAYMEFAPAEASALPLLDSCQNLLILRTFSKAFAGAGIRCGYVFAAPDIIDVFAAVRQVYSVNALTQSIACSLIGTRDVLAPVIEQICAERERMYEALLEFEAVRVWKSSANFLLVRMPHASYIRNKLAHDFSILVRDFSNTEGLADCLRISVGTPAENNATLNALTTLLKED